MTNMTGILLNGFINAINHCDQDANQALSNLEMQQIRMSSSNKQGGGVKSGADTRSRTRDLLITSQLLYQLSYIGMIDSRRNYKAV